MVGESSAAVDRVRTAEFVAALSLATDLGMGFPLEHGLQSTLVGMRIADRLDVDEDTARQAYYGCLLFYIGCTADAEVAAGLFAEGALLTHFTPVMFGSPAQTLAGVIRALADVDGRPSAARALRAVSSLPRAARGHRRHIAALCEVAQMLTARVGLPDDVSALSATLTERWDGRGEPSHLRGERIPLGARIAQVARDTTFHHMLGGREHTIRTVRERAGHAFDPSIVAVVTDTVDELFDLDAADSAWDEVLAGEPGTPLTLVGDEIDRCLAAMADFADLLSPYLTGHSSGVAMLAAEAARHRGLPEPVVDEVRRAGYVHDLGRVAIAAQVWQKAGPLTPDERERVRLHPYYTERVLSRSPFLHGLASLAGAHHERLDRSGYHRGMPAASLRPPARLLAAADAYQAMTSPRPHREALTPAQAAQAAPGRGERRAAGGRLCGGRARCRRAGAPAPGPTGRADRPRGAGGRTAGPWAADQADRPSARHFGQDRRPAHPECVRQDRRVQPSRGGAVRHGARAGRMGRTPYGSGRPTLIASRT